MADPTDPKKSLKELISEFDTQKSINQEVQRRLQLITELAAKNEELTDNIDDQKAKYDQINERINLVKKSKSELIDAEQILKGFEEQKEDYLKKQFRINQDTYLLLLEEIDKKEKSAEKNEEELDRLEKKKEQLLGILKSQGQELEKLEKQKELKEKILSLGKDILNNALKYGEELEKHIIEISRLNGGYDKYTSSLREANNLMYAASVGTGLRIEELNKAFQGLSANFIGLTTQSVESITAMGKAVADLGKLGVDAATASKSFDSLVTAMGKTPQQAVKIQDSFTQMAAKNRLALGSVTQAFAENSSRFVGYGEQMTKVLDGLAEQSLKTGVAISKLVGIAQQFDTFEGAARAVGNLNALLGGDYLNSIELLTASDDERIKLLKEGVAASGMQWQSMNRFQQMAVANAAGINDLNEASKIFGQTSLQNTRQQAEGAEVQKTLAQQAQSMTLAMDKLKSSLNGLILILEPIVTIFMKLVGFLSEAVQGLNNFLSSFEILGKTGAAIVTSVIVLMISKFSLLGKALAWVGMTILTKLVSAFGSLTASAAPAGASTASALTTIGSAATASAAGLLALGGSILFIGIGIGAAAFGFSKLVASFKDLSNTGTALLSIVFIMTAFTIVIAKLGSVALLFAGPIVGLAGSLMAIGGAVALIGAGIGMAAAGIGYMMSSISNLVDSLGKLNKADFDALFLIFSDDNIKKIEKFSQAISKLSEPFSSINENIKSIANNMSIVFPNISLDITGSPNSLTSFLSQLSSIDVVPINNLANAIYNLATNLETLAAIPSKMGVSVTGKTDLTETINKTMANAAETTTAMSKAVSTTTTAQPLIPAAQTTTFVPLIVQIDKKNILNVLTNDIQSISRGEALNVVEAVGIAQSSSGIQDRIAAMFNK
jgi:hypothetical protein